MSHPIAIAEQAVRSFIMQWFSGLTPSLQLFTKSDGSISVMSQLSSFPVVSQKTQDFFATCHHRRRRRRSGFHARLRRRNERSIKSVLNSVENIEDSKSLNLEVDDDQPSPPTTLIGTLSHSSVKPNLIVEKLPSIDIEPSSPCPPNLTIQPQSVTSVPPRTVHHPAVINACYCAMPS